MDFNVQGQLLSFSKERDAYNSLRLRFKELSQIAGEEFKSVYLDENHSLEDVSKNAHDQGNSILWNSINTAIEILLKNSIYDLDKEAFAKEYYAKYYHFVEVYNSINDKYLEIVLEQEDLDNYRKAKREGRGKVVGGGFGVSGAAKGMATAGALNLAGGAVHGIFNGIGKMISTSAASRKKSCIFKNPDTLNTLIEGIEEAVFSIHYALIDVFNQYMPNKQFKSVTTEMTEKATRILNNVKSQNLSVDESTKLAFIALEINPYDEECYKYFLEKFGDQDSSLITMAEYFGITDLEDYKFELLDSKLEQLDFTSEENAKKARDYIQELMNYYGVESYEKSSRIDLMIEEFDLKARTVDGIVFPDREGARVAGYELEEIIKLIQQIDDASKNEVEAIYNKLCSKYRTVIADKYKKTILDRIKELDLAERTVLGVVFDTIKEAEVGRKIQNDFEYDFEIVKNSSNDLEKLKSNCSENLSPLKESFINVIDMRVREISYENERPEYQNIVSNPDNKDTLDLYKVYDQLRKESDDNPLRNEFLPSLKRTLIKRKKEYDEKYQKALTYKNSRSESAQNKFGSFIGVVIVGCLLTYFFNLIGLGFTILGFIGMAMNNSEEKKAWNELTQSGHKELVEIELEID